jgi:hypothetical protein
MAHRSAFIAITIGLLAVATTPAAAGHRPLVPRSAANRIAARTAAARELALVRLPPGAKRVSADPSVGRWFAGSYLSGPGTPNLVDRRAFWRVPGQPGAVYAWILAHKPRGSSFEGCSCDGSAPYDVSYAFPSQRKSVDNRAVQIGVDAARGGGTAIRADGQAVWLVPRPRWLRIRSATRVTVRISTPASSGATTLASRRKLEPIAHLIDRLPLVQPAFTTCSFPNSLAVTLVFRSASDVIARVEDDDQGCGLVNVELPDHPTETLEGGHKLAELVRRLGGIASCRGSRRHSSACLPPNIFL